MTQRPRDEPYRLDPQQLAQPSASGSVAHALRSSTSNAGARSTRDLAAAGPLSTITSSMAGGGSASSSAAAARSKRSDPGSPVKGAGGASVARKASVVTEYFEDMNKKKQADVGTLTEVSAAVSFTDAPDSSSPSASAGAAGGGETAAGAAGAPPFVRSRMRRLSFAPATMRPGADGADALRPASRASSNSSDTVSSAGSPVLPRSFSDLRLSPAAFFSAHRHLVPVPAHMLSSTTGGGNNGASNPAGGALNLSGSFSGWDPLEHFRRASGAFRFAPGRFALQYPESLYGPYAERLDVAGESSSPNGRLSLAASVASLKPRQAGPRGGRTTGSASGSPNPAASVSFLRQPAAAADRPADTPAYSLAELARAVAGRGSRQFDYEWRAACLMQPQSLSQLGAQLHSMAELAESFAQSVTPIAVKIIEERNVPPSTRTYKPLPLPFCDGVFLAQGNIFVVSETPSRVSLFGGREAARRAALNEIRAVRTALGSPFLGLRTALSCVVSHLGLTVFVSAPVALPPDCAHKSITYGAFSAEHVFTDPLGTYNAYKLAEFFPLVKHAVPSGDHNTKSIYTASDVKQFYMKEDGSTLLLDAARWMPPAATSEEYARQKQRDDGGAGSPLLGHGGGGGGGTTTGSSDPSRRHPLESGKTAHLSVLFRPEFMRNACPVGLNGDAGTPSQPSAQQENIGFALHSLLSTQVPLLAQELLRLFLASELQCEKLSTVFHRHGVNMRYLGHVHSEVDALSISEKAVAKPHEVRTGLKHLLEIEAAARAWKSIVRDEFSEAILTKTESDIALRRVRQLLMAVPHDSEVFWENNMRERMEQKFGFFVWPALAISTDGESGDAIVRKVDPNSLKVLRAVRNTSIVVEETPQVYRWIPTETGRFVVDPASVASSTDGEASAHNVFPLLGPNSRLNAVLYRRALQLTGIEMVSDVRGKRIVVSFKPLVKVASPLIISPTVRAAAQHAPGNLADAIATKRDTTDICDAVEAAARAEVAAMMRHSETDPRATLPLRLLALAQIGKGQLPQAYQSLSRWFELRKTLQLDLVVGYSALEIAPLFASARRFDRAESLLVDGLRALLTAPEGVDAPSYCSAIFNAASLVGDILWAESSRPPPDRLTRVLEYLHYACAVAEEMEHPLLPFIIDRIATLRRQHAEGAACASCGARATVVSHAHDTDSADMHARERDMVSNSGSRTTAQTAAQLRRQAHLHAHRRSRTAVAADEKRDEDSMADVFIKSTLGPVKDVMAPNFAPATLASSAGDDASRMVTSGLLQGVAKPHVSTKLARYRCERCASAAVAGGDCEPIESDTVRLLTRAVGLWRRLGTLQVVGDATLATALVTLGVLQADSDAVESGTQQLSAVFGSRSRHVINAQLQLVDVLIKKSAVTCRYTGATRDIQCLVQAETVLRQIFDKIFSEVGAGAFEGELATAVHTMRRIIDIYSQQPVAKREHQAIHYLVDVLREHLGDVHPLVGTALSHIRSYYVQLSTVHRADPAAASTALQTAGKLAVQWLRCRVSSPDAADDVESHLTVIRDDIIKVLRSGGVHERQAAADIASACHGIVHASQYAGNEQIVGAMRLIDDVFKTQLRVIEQSERTERALQRLAGIRKQIQQCAASIARHGNGTDRYATAQVARMAKLRDVAIRVGEEVRDPAVYARVHAIVIAHDDILEIDHDPKILAKIPLLEEDGEIDGEAVRGRNELLSATTAGRGDGGRPSPPTMSTKGRAYVSPYAFLGTGESTEQLLEALELGRGSSLSNTHGSNFAVGGGPRGSVTSPPTTSLPGPSRSWGSPGGGGGGGGGGGSRRLGVGAHSNRDAAPNAAAVAAFALMSEQSGRSKKTTAQLARLLPKLNNTIAKKQFAKTT